MMRLAAALALALAAAATAAGYPGSPGIAGTPSGETSPNPRPGAVLVEEAASLDGLVVAFEGEAIGSPMRRPGGVWVNVGDGTAVIGLWLTPAQAVRIRRFGSYRMIGDRVRVEGVFHRACADHGGDLDIHAASLAVLEPGRPSIQPLDPNRAAIAAVLLTTGTLLALAWRRRARTAADVARRSGGARGGDSRRGADGAS